MTVKMLLTLVSQTGPIKTPLSLSGDMHIKTSHNNMVSRWSSGDRMKIKKRRILTDDQNYSEDSQYIIIRYSSHDHQITCCFCWYHQLILCWYSVIIFWLPAETSVDHVSIICSYTVIIWWLHAVPADIQSELSVDTDDYLLFLMIFSQNHQLTLYW